MATLAADPTPGPSAPQRRGLRASLWALRVVAAITTLAVSAQPLLAGYYLDGDLDALVVHGINAHSLLGLVFLQAVVALVYLTAGRGRAWPLLASIPLWFAVGTQIGMGYQRNLGIHVPLGVTIVVAQIAMTGLLFRRSAREPRTWGRKA